MESLVRELKTVMEELDKEETLLTFDTTKALEPFEARRESIANKRTRIQELKDAIEPLAEAEYKEKKVKKMFGGIGIRDTKTLEYDVEKAEEWAKEKGLFMILDKKAFDKSAPTLGLDFVKTGTEPKVTFPKTIKLED